MLLYYHCRQCRGGPCVRPQKRERSSLSPTVSTPCNGTLLIAFVLYKTGLYIGFIQLVLHSCNGTNKYKKPLTSHGSREVYSYNPAAILQALHLFPPHGGR